MSTASTLEKKLIGRKQLAKLTGHRDSTLKFYSEQGLLPFEQAGQGLARRYDLELAGNRLREIEDLRQAGLSIEQIKTRLLS